MSLAPWGWRAPLPPPPVPDEVYETVFGLASQRDDDSLSVLADFAEERGFVDDAEILRGSDRSAAEALRDVYLELASE